jgi:hypothetical protein
LFEFLGKAVKVIVPGELATDVIAELLGVEELNALVALSESGPEG